MILWVYSGLWWCLGILIVYLAQNGWSSGFVSYSCDKVKECIITIRELDGRIIWYWFLTRYTCKYYHNYARSICVQVIQRFFNITTDYVIPIGIANSGFCVPLVQSDYQLMMPEFGFADRSQCCWLFPANNKVICFIHNKNMYVYITMLCITLISHYYSDQMKSMLNCCKTLPLIGIANWRSS